MTPRARSRRSDLAVVIQTRATSTMDAAIASYAERHGVTFSEAMRKLLELGIVAERAVERDRPTGPYRFRTVRARDAGDDDEPLLTPEDDS